MNINSKKVCRGLLYALLALTGLACVVIYAMLSSIGILIHDTIYTALPERVDIWSPLTGDLLDALIPYFLLLISFLGIWVIASTIMILVLTKKQKSIEQGVAGYDPQAAAMHTHPHAAHLSSTARGSSPER